MRTEPATWGGPDSFKADYSETSAIYKTLVDIRFRLLAFVPTASAIAVALLGRPQAPSGGDPGRTHAPLALAVGIVGFLVTCGVVMYEVRNSQMHDQAVHRLKHLEKLLGLRPAVSEAGPGGFFEERGGRLSIAGVALWHDRALAVIYGTTAGAWTWLIYGAGKEVVDLPGPTVPRVLAWLVPAAVAIAIAWQVVRLSDHGRAGAPLYTLCGRDIGDDWPTRWHELRLVLEHAGQPKSRPWRMRKDRFVERVTKALGERDGRAKAMTELARGLGLLETTRMTVFLRARADFRLDARTPGARAERRRRYRLTRRGELLLKAVQDGDGRERSRLLVEALRGGVIGVEDLADWGPDLDQAKERLRARYGANAPWCSEAEIALRVEWLRDATGEPRTVQTPAT